MPSSRTPAGAAMSRPPELIYSATETTVTVHGTGVRALLRSIGAPAFRAGRGRFDTPLRWLPAIERRVLQLGGSMTSVMPSPGGAR